MEYSERVEYTCEVMKGWSVQCIRKFKDENKPLGFFDKIFYSLNEMRRANVEAAERILNKRSENCPCCERGLVAGK